MPAAPHDIRVPRIRHESAASLCAVGASSRALRGTHPFDPCSLHPRAYAQTSSLTDSPRSAACRQKLSGNSSPFALRPSGVVGPFWAC